MPVPDFSLLGKVASQLSQPPSYAAEGAKESVQVSTGQVHSLPSSPSTDFDAARVASIREDIRAGRYEIHPERIAKGLLASVRDLLGAKKDL